MLFLQNERHSVHRVLRVHILHGRSQTDQYQFLRYDALCHDHAPAFTVVSASATIICTAALMANIFLVVLLKSIPIGTAEILRNISDINTVPGVVGVIHIFTTSSSTTATSSKATTSVASVTLPDSTTTAATTTSSSSSYSPHLQELTFLIVLDLCIWKYPGDMNGQVGHFIDKILSIHIKSKALTSVQFRIIWDLDFL